MLQYLSIFMVRCDLCSGFSNSRSEFRYRIGWGVVNFKQMWIFESACGICHLVNALS